MKSAIDEIVFLGLRSRMSLRQAIVDLIQRQTAPATLAIKYLIGEIIFLTPVSALPDGGGVRRSLLRGLSRARTERPRSKLVMKDSIGEIF